MKRLAFFLLVLGVILSTISCTKLPQETPAEQKPPQTLTGQTTPSTKDPSTQPVKETQVKIYLLALDDHGRRGKDIGTGDSLVTVERTISDSKTPLKDAFVELLSLREPYYGQSGLYNALSRSHLTFDKAAITDGKAEIYLTGSLSLGGVMDNPRVENQLNETALQFSTIREVQIYLNGKPLKEALSLK